ncbi:uncharacterized protein BDV14DRAFT_195144 [Aspergillus stella-maris]|uniref:uncharacterized protein n=1 Tax=Aspergillus stella-maris TaxID=1810926 RepID=UPI003CCE43AB
MLDRAGSRFRAFDRQLSRATPTDSIPLLHQHIPKSKKLEENIPLPLPELSFPKSSLYIKDTTRLLFYREQPNTMYSYTPTSKFLVLAPIQSAPLSVATEQTEIGNTQVRERSDSKSSTSSSSQLGRGVARLPAGFLYLGHDHPRNASPIV